MGISGMEMAYIDLCWLCGPYFKSHLTCHIVTTSEALPGIEWLFGLFYTAFFVWVVLLMLNLLIAMINNTYGAYIDSRLGLVLMEKYNITSGIQKSTFQEESSHLKRFLTLNGDNKYEYEYIEAISEWKEQAKECVNIFVILHLLLLLSC
jgi:hypothetical protein